MGYEGPLHPTYEAKEASKKITEALTHFHSVTGIYLKGHFGFDTSVLVNLPIVKCYPTFEPEVYSIRETIE